MRIQLKEIDVSTDYDNAGYELQFISNGRMFDAYTGVKLILVPDRLLTDTTNLVECRLSFAEARRLSAVLLAAAENGEPKYGKPTGDYKR